MYSAHLGMYWIGTWVIIGNTIYHFFPNVPPFVCLKDFTNHNEWKWMLAICEVETSYEILPRGILVNATLRVTFSSIWPLFSFPKVNFYTEITLLLVIMQILHVFQEKKSEKILVLPSPPRSSLCTTALTLEASSPTELCRILFATSSPLSADSTTTGRRSAIRAHDWSSYVHLLSERWTGKQKLSMMIRIITVTVLLTYQT